MTGLRGWRDSAAVSARRKLATRRPPSRRGGRPSLARGGRLRRRDAGWRVAMVEPLHHMQRIGRHRPEPGAGRRLLSPGATSRRRRAVAAKTRREPLESSSAHARSSAGSRRRPRPGHLPAHTSGLPGAGLPCARPGLYHPRVTTAGSPSAQDPVARSGLPPERLVALYRLMALARALDERAWILNRSGRVHFVISGQGHEGAEAGITRRPHPRPRLAPAVLPLHDRRHGDGDDPARGDAPAVREGRRSRARAGARCPATTGTPATGSSPRRRRSGRRSSTRRGSPWRRSCAACRRWRSSRWARARPTRATSTRRSTSRASTACR